MSFSIKVNGEEVHTLPEDQRVTHLAVMTAKGAIGEANIEPSQGEVNIIVSYADARDRNLIDVQAQTNPPNITEEMEADTFPPIVPNTEVSVLEGDSLTAPSNESQPPMSSESVPAEDTASEPSDPGVSFSE